METKIKVVQLPDVQLSTAEYWRSCSLPGYEYFRYTEYSKIFRDAAAGGYCFTKKDLWMGDYF